MRRLPDWNFLSKAQMIKVCVVSDNEDFKNDLVMQMTKYIDDFAPSEDFPDVFVVDEQEKQVQAVRQLHPSVPVILLTAKNIESTDFLNQVIHKPFALWQLLDAIVAINNKLDNSDEGVLCFNSYELQPNKRLITDTVSGNAVKLTEKEVSILKYLYKTKQNYVSKSDLQTNVWLYNETVTTHTVETHIYRLRQKVEKKCQRRLILTENGCYKLNVE